MKNFLNLHFILGSSSMLYLVLQQRYQFLLSVMSNEFLLFSFLQDQDS